MQKLMNDLDLSNFEEVVVTEQSNIEVSNVSDVKVLEMLDQTKRSKSKKSSKSTDNYDQNHNVTQQFREEIISQHRPPQGSLSELVFFNQIELLQEQLINAEPNERDGVGSTSSWTPLYWAVKFMKYDAARILLEHGSNINTVVNDCEECCGTVLDLATLRGDDEMENLLRAFAEKDDVEFGQSFKAIRTKLRGKAPAFNFRYYGKKKVEETA